MSRYGRKARPTSRPKTALQVPTIKYEVRRTGPSRRFLLAMFVALLAVAGLYYGVYQQCEVQRACWID